LVPTIFTVNVFACNRPAAVTSLIEKLISFRQSKDLFPITISQDCDDIAVQRAVASFREKVNYIKHKSAQQEGITVPSVHSRYSTYYYIARHYKLALEYVFDMLGYNTVILLEDDLDVSADFFEYFSATRYLLEIDRKLWCVSAWNDNGKNGSIDLSANSLLYRSDFFSGLGWMMTRKLWKELGPKWPIGFWDDWLREPEIRNGRQCIRPEISRTKMTLFGKAGASKGLFFDKHLAKVVLNTAPVVFTSMNLDYLLNVSCSFFAFFFTVQVICLSASSHGMTRISFEKFMKIAGVPRTAYQGIVSCFMNGVRIFLVPNREHVKGYDKRWNVPANYDK
uniref:Alpha-1,3-mannosyl-glycoprotein 2-beta-N-acetylglucosaminyltransferase n=1 Tax=Angiostrongylus cantonensis TaxID=6313 RepID=A0A0K0CWD7_ANGCA